VRRDDGLDAQLDVSENRRKNALREIAITISGMTRETKISVEYPEDR